MSTHTNLVDVASVETKKAKAILDVVMGAVLSDDEADGHLLYDGSLYHALLATIDHIKKIEDALELCLAKKTVSIG